MKLSVILEIFPNGWEVNKNPYQRSRISCEVQFEPIICAILHISQYEKINNMTEGINPLSYLNRSENGWLIIFPHLCGI